MHGRERPADGPRHVTERREEPECAQARQQAPDVVTEALDLAMRRCIEPEDVQPHVHTVLREHGGDLAAHDHARQAGQPQGPIDGVAVGEGHEIHAGSPRGGVRTFGRRAAGRHAVPETSPHAAPGVFRVDVGVEPHCRQCVPVT